LLFFILTFVIVSDKLVQSFIDSFSIQGNDFTVIIRMTR